MVEVDELKELIIRNIIEAYRKSKTELFEENGKVFGRNWEDLTPRYKKWKTAIIGHPYPINILTEELLKGLLDEALIVDVYYDTHLDKMNFKIDINSDRIGLSYADDVNNKREYISFSPEEKEIIVSIVSETTKSYLEELNENG